MRYIEYTYDEIRKAMPKKLSWVIKELLIGNVVVGNYSGLTAIRLAETIYNKLTYQYEMDV